jgi:hypothetical protein
MTDAHVPERACESEDERWADGTPAPGDVTGRGMRTAAGALI